MKKIVLAALLLVAFITFSFRLIGNKKQRANKEISQGVVSADNSRGLASSDPIN